MSSLKEQILKSLKAKPNQTAKDLASSLRAERRAVNSLLYGQLRDQVIQDKEYRWSLVDTASRGPSKDPDSSGDLANTDLARLCRYYLACLGFDDTGVSTFLTSAYGEPDYFELRSLPQSAEDLADSEASRRILGRKRSEQGRYGLYFGYPTNIALIHSKTTDWEGYIVEPILLYPIEQQANGRLVVDLAFPTINQKPFQRFTSVEREMLMNELVHLEQELGIGGEEGSIEIDEIAMRLQAVRPEWPWKEAIDPEAITMDRAPMAGISEPGIYNRPIILMAEKSPYTQGLEKELRDLAKLPEARYEGTALGRWLNRGKDPKSDPEPFFSQIEVLPMNAEQRQAVSRAIDRPVTIITGPPGTGKSQVVTNLLINAAWAGKRVLFASKNNKAVDVVEARVNALGPRPILLRVGAQAYQARLSEYVLALLSATTTTSEMEEFQEEKGNHAKLASELRGLSEQTERLIDLRNTVDHLEQAAEAARDRLGPDQFASCLDLDLQSLRTSGTELAKAVARADRSQLSILLRFLWPLVRSKRLQSLGETLRIHRDSLLRIGTQLPNCPVTDEGVPPFRELAKSLLSRIEDIETAAT